MSRDALSDALRALRLRGTTYFTADLSGRWGMDIQAGAFANFHFVLAGQCFVRLPDRPPLALERGHLALLPYGHPHLLASEPDAPTTPAEELVPRLVEAGQLGRGPLTTRLVCGHFELDRESRHPLLTGLPPLLVVTAPESEPWTETMAQLASSASQTPGPGSAAIVDRLAEVLIIRILVQWSEQNEMDTGFLAASADPGLGAALQAIHAEPARSWTVDALAGVAGMSRSVFAARFRDRLQMSPGAYVIGWRLLRARQWMVETADGLDAIAERAGYADAFSFARAFKRAYGVAPGAWRRAQSG